MKLSTLQLLSGLGLTSPFEIVPAAELLSESDTYSEDEAWSDDGLEPGFMEDNISLSPSSPQLPDLVMSTQLTGEKKTYSKATPRSALISKKAGAQQKQPVTSSGEETPKPETSNLKENESTEDLSSAAKPQAVAKKILVPRKQVLKPIPDGPVPKSDIPQSKPKTVSAESKTEPVKKAPELPKKTPKKVKEEDSSFISKTLIPETGLSLSGRAQRKRARPKRFQEAFEELENLAKKYRHEKDEEDRKSRREETETEGEDEGIDSEESEESEQDERSELEKDLEAFQPKDVLKRVHKESGEEKSPTSAGLRKFYCDRCKKQFKSRHEYDRHRATIMCTCRCVECQLSFKNEEFFKAHMESEHQPLAVLKKTLAQEKETEEQKPSKSPSQKEQANTRSSASKPAPKTPTPASKQTPTPAVKQTPKTPATTPKVAPKKPVRQSGKPRKLDPANAPRRCCVVNCPKIPGNAKYLCTFPKELELAEKWEQKIEKANGERLTPLDVYVCSKHFREELYMGSGLLKPGSVPSIFSNPKKKLSK